MLICRNSPISGLVWRANFYCLLVAGERDLKTLKQVRRVLLLIETKM